MGFIALWWRALLWRWTVTLLSKWNHRLASIPREKGHLLSTGECSRGGYARWRLHAFSTQLPCIAIHLWSEKTDSAKAKLMYNIEFEYPSLYCQQRRSKTGARTHRQKQTHLVGSISMPAHMRSLKSREHVTVILHQVILHNVENNISAKLQNKNTFCFCIFSPESFKSVAFDNRFKEQLCLWHLNNYYGVIKFGELQFLFRIRE